MEFFTKSTTEVVQVSFDLHPRHDQWLRLDQSLYKQVATNSFLSHFEMTNTLALNQPGHGQLWKPGVGKVYCGNLEYLPTRNHAPVK